MPESAISSLTVGEISNMLIEEWGKKPIESISINDLSPEQIEDLEDPHTRAENEYLSGQTAASKAEPLKKYYQNPQKENLIAIKSRLGRGIVPEFSYLATIYLMQMLEGAPRNERQEKAYQTVILQERIRATPDEIWEAALEKNANELKDVKDASDVDDYDFPKYLCYYGTLKIEGNVDGLLQDYISVYNEDIERIAKSMISFGIYEIGSTTAYLGAHIAEQNHLTEKGLDGFINSNMLNAFQKTDKDGDAYFMRFFVVKEKVDDWISGIGGDNTSSNKYAEKCMHQWSSAWKEYLLEHGLKITQVDERIQPMPTRGGYLDATSRLSCGYTFSCEREPSPCSSEAI